MCGYLMVGIVKSTGTHATHRKMVEGQAQSAHSFLLPSTAAALCNVTCNSVTFTSIYCSGSLFDKKQDAVNFGRDLTSKPPTPQGLNYLSYTKWGIYYTNKKGLFTRKIPYIVNVQKSGSTPNISNALVIQCIKLIVYGTSHNTILMSAAPVTQ